MPHASCNRGGQLREKEGVGFSCLARVLLCTSRNYQHQAAGIGRLHAQQQLACMLQTACSRQRRRGDAHSAAQVPALAVLLFVVGACVPSSAQGLWRAHLFDRKAKSNPPMRGLTVL